MAETEIRCSRCSTVLPHGAKFCWNCGLAIGAEAALTGQDLYDAFAKLYGGLEFALMSYPLVDKPLDTIRAFVKANPELATVYDERTLTTPLHLVSSLKQSVLTLLPNELAKMVNSLDDDNPARIAFQSLEMSAEDYYSSLSVPMREIRLELLRTFLARRADLSARDEDGRTPLHVAIDAMTPFQTAARRYYDERALTDEGLEEFLEAASENPARGFDGDGASPLYYQEPNRPIVELLIKRQADPNARDLKGQTPVHFAVKAGYPEVLAELRDAGGDFTAKDALGTTPLAIAQNRNLTGVAWTIEHLYLPHE